MFFSSFFFLFFVVVVVVVDPPKREDSRSGKMPQLNGGGGDDLGANDEMISFKDEGEQEEKISENSSAERDLADVKSSLVNESETNQNSSSDSEVSSQIPGRSRRGHRRRRAGAPALVTFAESCLSK